MDLITTGTLFAAALVSLSAPSSLSDLVDPGAKVEKVQGGFQFVEGPAWSPQGFLLFSDIPPEKIVKLDADGKTSDFLHPSGAANGLAFDAKGNLYVCQGGARRVIRISPEGARSVIADAHDGKKLNSPNDLDLDGSGGLYFTDPRYGGSDPVEQDVMGVYYAGPDGKVTRVISDLKRPNGVVLSPDRKRLYVANPDRRELHMYAIEGPGKLGPGKLIFTGDEREDGGGPDGITVDASGNIYTTYRGIVVLDPNGKLIGRIPVPEHPANCGFGGKDGKTLFITARTGLYRIATKAAAAPLAGPGPEGKPEKVAQGGGAPAGAAFRMQTIDSKVGIGYGLAVADVDGDAKSDVVLVDKDIVAWYRNPGWEKSVIAEKLTAIDHVCIAAADIDGDGKADLAAGAGWNPGDTVGSGSVHYLVPPADRTGRWEPLALHHEPTVHRMRWMRTAGGSPRLLVVPLHGRGNKGGEGVGVKVLAYEPPADGKAPWKTEVLDDALHIVHNLEVVKWDGDPEDEILLAAKEGVFRLDRGAAGWEKKLLGATKGADGKVRGAGEVRTGRLPGGKRFIAAVEPWHGNHIAAYTEGGSPESFEGHDVDTTLAEAHALACGDVLGAGSDQVVAGWRKKDKEGKVGIRLYTPLDGSGKSWKTSTVDSGTMACEDLTLADLNKDGRLDVVAAGRDTHNLVIYWNEGPGP